MSGGKGKKGKETKFSEKCFYITIDGKQYGAYLFKYFDKVKKFQGLKGIEFRVTWLKSGWVEFEPPKVQVGKRDKSTPLLDGMNFIPVVGKGKKGWEPPKVGGGK